MPPLPPAVAYVGAASAVRMLPPSMRHRAKDFFTYVIEFLPLAGGEEETEDFTVQANSDFAVVALSAVITSADNLTFIAPESWPFLARLFDAGSDLSFSDRPVHLSGYFGTAREPFFLPWIRIVRGASTVQATVQNLDPATPAGDRNVRLYFHGYKVWEYPEEQQ